MTDIGTETGGEPARKPRKYKRRTKRAAVARPLPTSSEFPGLSARECCSGCGPKGCIISAGGSGVCSHPNKGGVRGTDMSVPDVVARGARAAKLLKHQKIDLRGEG